MACLPTTSPLLVGSMYGAANVREWCLATLIVVFRGIGQVVFMNSPLAGALIFAGLVVHSPFTAFCGLWATLSATVTAWFWYFPTSRLESGLYGYSACLTGIAMATFSPLMRWPAFRFFTASIVPDDSFPASSPPAAFTLSDRDASLLLLALIFAVAVFGVAAAFVQEALINTLRRHFKLPTFTLAFNLVTVLYFFGSFSFKFVPSDIVPPIHSLAAPPPFTVDAHAAFSAGRFLQGAFLGVGQVFFASHWLTSVLVLAGMCVCSRPLAAAALFGSVIGALVGAAVGADLNDLYFGLYGFNSVLASVAMYALMNVQTRVRLLLLATAAAAGAALCFAAAKTFMRYWFVKHLCTL
jgi:solute carrier family 14 (urea transporter)